MTDCCGTTPVSPNGIFNGDKPKTSTLSAVVPFTTTLVQARDSFPFTRDGKDRRTSFANLAASLKQYVRPGVKWADTVGSSFASGTIDLEVAPYLGRSVLPGDGILSTNPQVGGDCGIWEVVNTGYTLETVTGPPSPSSGYSPWECVNGVIFYLNADTRILWYYNEATDTWVNSFYNAGITYLRGMEYAGGVYFLRTETTGISGYTVYKSTDLITWTDINIQPYNIPGYGITSDGIQWIYPSYLPGFSYDYSWANYLVSTDLVTWSVRTYVPQPSPPNLYIVRNVSYFNNKWYALILDMTTLPYTNKVVSSLTAASNSWIDEITDLAMPISYSWSLGNYRQPSEGTFYILGGTPDSSTAAWRRLDSATNTWYVVPKPPITCTDYWQVGKYLYATVFELSPMYFYDPTTNVWTEKAGLPTSADYWEYGNYPDGVTSKMMIEYRAGGISGGARTFKLFNFSSGTATVKLRADSVVGSKIYVGETVLAIDTLEKYTCTSAYDGAAYADHLTIGASPYNSLLWEILGEGNAVVEDGLNQFAPTTSAELAAIISDETGTGQLVFATSPALGGTPTAPTAAPGTSSTQLATTAFVMANGGGSTVIDGGFPDSTYGAITPIDGGTP